MDAARARPAAAAAAAGACEPPKFGLDPLYWANAKVFARTLLDAQPYSNFEKSVQLFGHPLRTVQLMGAVVRLHANHQRTLFLLDDGSALMPCIWWQDAFERKYGAGRSFEQGGGDTANPFELGDYISVCGQVKWYQEEMQLRVETAWAERDPNAEALWHAEVVHLTRDWVEKAHAPARLEPGEAAAAPAGGGAAAAAASDGAAAAGASGLDAAGGGQQAVGVEFGESPFVEAMRYHVRKDGREEFSFSDLQAVPELRMAAEAAVADGAGRQAVAASSAATEMRLAHLFSRCIGVRAFFTLKITISCVFYTETHDFLTENDFIVAAEGVVYLKDVAADIYGCISAGVISAALSDVIHAAEQRRTEYEDGGVPCVTAATSLGLNPGLTPHSDTSFCVSDDLVVSQA